MKLFSRSPVRGSLVLAAAGVLSLAVQAAQPPEPATGAPAATPASGTAAQQQTFATPEEALIALREATSADDKATLARIFGPGAKDLANPDQVQEANECEAFSRHLAEMANLVRDGDDRVILYVGGENWPFPIPIVRKDGRWCFDTAAGKDEILSRRIGENELNTIDVCRAYVAAQNEFHATDWNGDGILEYAQFFRSSLNRKDGLYWEATDGEPQSPMGPLVADAQAQGYPIAKSPPKPADGRTDDHTSHPFHGYLFKILTSQGPHAPGGAYSYVINGHMVAGFALLAYPAEWGKSGVMTFVVCQRGIVYQRNLGDKTGELAPATTEFDPDDAWKPVGQ